MLVKLLIATILVFISSCNQLNSALSPIKPRVIILTDISSLDAKEAEPDDGQSLIRLMLYSNELDIEGLIATSNLGHGLRTRPDLIRKVVEAYGEVQPNLIKHDQRFPSVESLLNVIHEGQSNASPEVSVFESIGEGKDTDASEWIIKVIDKNDPRPVWIGIWGGSADLAQALWKVKKNRSPQELATFISKIKVDACGDQDETGPWLRNTFNDLFYILREEGIRGMYRGGDTTLVDPSWIATNLRNHGSLGNLYVNYDGGDIWSWKIGKVLGIKEGDSPIMLSNISNGLNDMMHPDWGGWGGRFKVQENNIKRWKDAGDKYAQYETDQDTAMSAVYRWRPAWQADFAARLDWCVRPFAEANHAPEFDQAPVNIVAISGTEVKLGGIKITDPDSDDISCKWYAYPEVTGFNGDTNKISSKGTTITFPVPHVMKKSLLHVVQEVWDNGTPSLVRYKRYIINIVPASVQNQ